MQGAVCDRPGHGLPVPLGEETTLRVRVREAEQGEHADHADQALTTQSEAQLQRRDSYTKGKSRVSYMQQRRPTVCADSPPEADIPCHRQRLGY